MDFLVKILEKRQIVKGAGAAVSRLLRELNERADKFGTPGQRSAFLSNRRSWKDYAAAWQRF